MKWAAFLPMAVFVLVAMRVGFGLHELSCRTGKLPERCLGLGLLLMGMIGAPLAALGRHPALFATVPGNLFFLAGSASVALGITYFFIFNWVVFHQQRGWTLSIVIAGGLVAFVGCAGLSYFGWSGESLAEALPRTRPWGLAQVAALALAFAWSSVQSLVWYGRQRRRLVLGLADPVVANRFLLWGVAGAAVALLCLAVEFFLLTGVVVLHDPMALSTMALAGCVASAAWWLTFSPPARYVEWVRAAAASSA